jgi:hypothetical protein
MEISDRIEVLEEDVANTKKEIQEILINIRVILLEAQNPIKDINSEALNLEDESETPPADKDKAKEEVKPDDSR